MTAEAATLGGPVSAVLEADLRTWVRRHGSVFWLDTAGHYTAFVDRLVAARAAGELPYDVRAFRGSYLELMLALEGLGGGTEPVPLVVHLPGVNEEGVRLTPLYELYAAGVRYRKGLDTLVAEAAAGRVLPEAIVRFTAAPELALEAADSWLAGLLDGSGGGFAAQLLALTPTAVFDDLLGAGFVAGRLADAADEAVLWKRLAVWTGLPASWRDTTLPAGRPRPEDVAFAVASWALSVEYVDDLRRLPVSPLIIPARALPRPVIEACRGIARHLRERHPDFYQRSADETEALLPDEIERAKAEDLGEVDTFRFEEDEVLSAALAALEGRAWDAAAGWARLRLDGKGAVGSFWLGREPARRSAWQLVADAARLGQALVAAGERLGAKGGLEAALVRYAERGAAVDEAHRHLEQRRLALLYPQLPEFEALRARLDGLRALWRSWADAWARDFNALCREHGFLPAAAQQQRALFDEVVRPLTQEAGTTAYFVIDAFRYEMGEELRRALEETPATTLHLRARLAELPSVTEVGMNVLAPVATGGRLAPALSPSGAVLGFSTGEFRVTDPATRRRAMHDRVGGATCPWLTLEDVVSHDSAWLKRSVAQARLVVVHSQEIDSAGEKGAGPAVFDVVMQKLRAAWRLLREAGVRRFVFTADHGFLLLDESTGSAQPHGRKIDPKRRHVISTVGADHAGEVRVPLAELGYEGAEGHLMFPDSTAVFDTGRRSMSFVHGGNSLQERVIPVLTAVHRAAQGGSSLAYRIAARALAGVADMHCVEVGVEMIAQQALDFGSPRDIELSLRVPDPPGVQVELCDARGGARLERGAVMAVVGERFELFFRLTGPSDARARVELHHPSAVALVEPCVPDARFAVAARRGPAAEAEAEPAARAAADWLAELPEGGVRQLFAHLAAHGAVTESEAVTMLGGQRALRRFAIGFEQHAEKAPFAVRIDVVAGVKRYVREGPAA